MYNIGIYCDALCREIVKFPVPRGKTEAFRSRLGNWIMDSPCDNRRPVGRLDADTWWSETLTRYEIHPELKAGRSSWRICRHASHLFDLQEQLLSLNVKKNHRSAPLVGTLPYSSCNSCVWTFLQLIMLGQKYSACDANFSSEECCYANDVSYGII